MVTIDDYVRDKYWMLCVFGCHEQLRAVLRVRRGIILDQLGVLGCSWLASGVDVLHIGGLSVFKDAGIR